MNREVNLNNKRKRLKLYYGLLITVVCIIGVSFAWFRLYLSQSEDNTLASRTCFSTTLTENTSKIALTDAFPISDEEGIKQTPFTFTLKNNCDSYVKVYITIKSTYRESTSTAYLKDNYLKVNISAKDKIDNTSVILGKQTLTKLDNNEQGYIIVHTRLKASEAKSFDLRIWMDSATTLEQGLNKTWNGKIVVITDASNTETTLTEAILANNEVQEPLTIPGLEVSAHTLDDLPVQELGLDENTKSRYITYGTGFEESGHKLKLTGVTVTSDTYANSYSSLVGKYVAASLPIVSSTTPGEIKEISESNISQILYIESASADSYKVKTISSVKNITEAVLSSTEDDYGTSYYFRGAVKNNYVQFANKCWRIVRITGNGAIKLVLHNNNMSGVSNPCDAENNNITAAYTGEKSAYNENYDDNAYMGFMYGTPHSNSYADTHANINKSTVLTNLENWYKSNLANYEDKLADVIWCNDKSIVADTSYSPLDESLFGIPTGLGYGNNFTFYKGFQRLELTTTTRDNELVETLSLSPATPVTRNDENWVGPSLVCPNDNNGGKLSKFTVNDTIYGNGNLDYKIGLLTADELAFSGMSSILTNNSDYLCENAKSQWWTLTPSFQMNISNMRILAQIYYYFLSDYEETFCNVEANIRPAIALNKETTISGGTGTSENPYIVN